MTGCSRDCGWKRGVGDAELYDSVEVNYEDWCEDEGRLVDHAYIYFSTYSIIHAV